ncbi:hypothetical protein PPYR_11874 [Photinus pyralis]|uniref:Tyr recombinase domain-containing protein n=1 Tax=Photinus pyralis TaxID=7054 RepID=A0A5N4ACI1_PHOPY|nr:hypothetical protein PPYR_11874 [Photinus pyralis]
MFTTNWERITSNPIVLSWISGYRIPFVYPPRQERPPCVKKKIRITDSIQFFLHTKTFSIRKFAAFIGVLVSACPAVQYGWGNPTSSKEPYPGSSAFIREALKRRGVPDCALEVMIHSISRSTEAQYNTTYKMWWKFCQLTGSSLFSSGPKEVIKFLHTILTRKSCGYGSFNSHRSALSLILPGNVGEDILLKRYLRGIANTRPPKPYTNTWNPHPVLNFLSNWFPNENLTLKQLSLKLLMLLLLTTGQRLNAIALIRIENIRESPSGFQIFISDKVKTTRVGKPQPYLQAFYFKDLPALCVGSTLKIFLQRTAPLRKNKSFLFLSIRRPHGIASKQTLSRWMKMVLQDSGIPTDLFKPHSTRHAATSVAFRQGVSVDGIFQSAGWGEESSCFARFYNRPIINETEFARAVLNSNNL